MKRLVQTGGIDISFRNADPRICSNAYFGGEGNNFKDEV